MDETWGRAWDSGTEDFKCAMFMDTAWFQSEDYVKAWQAKIPTSVQHILTLTWKDFRFIEYRNLKQRHSEGSYGWQIFNPVESLAQQKTDPVW